jgi:hypothetical protein
MKKAIFLLFSAVFIMLPYAQASDKSDRYMNESDWYQFNNQRVSNPSLSDQDRWASAQLAAQNFQNFSGKSISAYELYDQGTRWAKDSVGGEYYHVNGQQYPAIKYHPPLSSNNNTGVYYPYSSTPSVTYQNSRNSHANSSDLLDDCRRIHQQDTGRNFDRDLEENCTIQ